MDSRLDRYLSYEYLVSPCPRDAKSAPGTAESLTDARLALQRASEAVDKLKTSCSHDEHTAAAITAVESELRRATALLDAAQNDSWLA